MRFCMRDAFIFFIFGVPASNNFFIPINEMSNRCVMFCLHG